MEQASLIGCRYDNVNQLQLINLIVEDLTVTASISLSLIDKTCKDLLNRVS